MRCLCALEPAGAVNLVGQLERWGSWGSGDVVSLGPSSRPTGAAWATGSLIPFGLAPRPAAGYDGAAEVQVRALASHARPRLVRHGSVFGPAADVECVWPHLERLGVRSQEERWCQPLLVRDPQAGGLAEPASRRRPQAAWAARGVRGAGAGELEEVLTASVAMFREEVGYDPVATPSQAAAYRSYVSWLVARRRTYVLTDPDTTAGRGPVAFKADVGALWVGRACPPGEDGPLPVAVAQLTGVWTRPDLRGQGVGSAALAAVVDAVRRDHVGASGVVSLYVNDFNEPAMALYRAVGFRREGTFATVLL